MLHTRDAALQKRSHGVVSRYSFVRFVLLFLLSTMTVRTGIVQRGSFRFAFRSSTPTLPVVVVVAVGKNKYKWSTILLVYSSRQSDRKPVSHSVIIIIMRLASSSFPLSSFTSLATVVTVFVGIVLMAAFHQQDGGGGASLVFSNIWAFANDDGTMQAAASAAAAEATCNPQDGTCTVQDDQSSSSSSSNVVIDQQKNTEFQVTFVNESPYRADIYWDDGRFGKLIATLSANGGSEMLNTYHGHGFFVTRHGMRELLFDLKKDNSDSDGDGDGASSSSEPEPYRFVTNIPSQTLIIPKSAAPSPNPCQDRYGICPHEAARGSCTATPGWMIVNCCHSCNASHLIDPKVRCSKEHLNMTEPIWKPGDLNALFQEWATSEEYKQYDPKVWSSPDGNSYGLAGNSGSDSGGSGTTTVPTGPWVMTFDSFFSAKEAQALIQGGRQVGFDRSTDQGAVNAASGEMEKVVSTTRTSSNAWCIGACESLPQVQAVTARIEKVTHIPQSHYESFQILEYNHNQFYRSHHDSSGRKDDTPSGHRILTFFLYLSNVEEGGETYFNRLKLGIKPKLGRALVWPSVLNDDPESWDPRMFHEAKDVIKGIKYAANHWIHLNDYITPNIWGCTGSFS